MRLPRASTNASAAVSATVDEAHTQQVPDSGASVSQEQKLQILQHLEAFDTENVFTGHLTADGRLSADGPQVLHNLRYSSHNHCCASQSQADHHNRLNRLYS